MNRSASPIVPFLLAGALLCCVSWANGRESARDASLKLEVKHAIEKGLAWLRTQQDPASGAFGDPAHPALTALPLVAMLGDPSCDFSKPMPDDVVRAFAFILGKQKPDGGIYESGLATYNTSICLLALSLSRNQEFEPAILAARRFLIGQQAPFNGDDPEGSPYGGGVGYGGTYTHSYLSNTHLALEALHYSRKALADTPAAAGMKKLDWDAAITFVQRCQNLPESNDQPWASDDPENRGGFIYFPGDSKAGSTQSEDGRVIHHSYGSMSYAGLLSFIYAEMDLDDPRVEAALDWLEAHYSIDENPGMGAEGLYYYYHTMAKALAIARVESLTLDDGSQADWRADLAKKLFNLQRADGSWANENGRWWEKDPILVTAYSVLALEHIYHGINPL